MKHGRERSSGETVEIYCDGQIIVTNYLDKNKTPTRRTDITCPYSRVSILSCDQSAEPSMANLLTSRPVFTSLEVFNSEGRRFGRLSIQVSTNPKTQIPGYEFSDRSTDQLVGFGIGHDVIRNLSFDTFPKSEF